MRHSARRFRTGLRRSLTLVAVGMLMWLVPRVGGAESLRVKRAGVVLGGTLIGGVAGGFALAVPVRIGVGVSSAWECRDDSCPESFSYVGYRAIAPIYAGMGGYLLGMPIGAAATASTLGIRAWRPLVFMGVGIVGVGAGLAGMMEAGWLSRSPVYGTTLLILGPPVFSGLAAATAPVASDQSVLEPGVGRKAQRLALRPVLTRDQKGVAATLVW